MFPIKLPIDKRCVSKGNLVPQNLHSTDTLCKDYISPDQCQVVTVSAHTGGIDVPSARFRIRQHITPLLSQRINIKERYLRWGRKKPDQPTLQPLWIAATVSDRLLSIAADRHADVTILQRQPLPAFLPVEPFIRHPIILDVDDAIWMNRGGKRAKIIAQKAVAVICGNRYLADYFRQFNKSVYVIPTAVDTNTIKPSIGSVPEKQVIGWIGSSENLKYLYYIETVLQEVLLRHNKAELLVVCNEAPRFKRITPNRVRFIPWSRESERKAFAEITVGIMPLEDSEWERGKCSFKMLCYMAAGLPVIVSPVGMNREVLELGNVGTGPSTLDEWISAFDAVFNDPDRATKMGATGRAVIMKKFCVDVISPQIARIIRWAASYR
jgi:glycosyltransferase involved in cell wall biosynthesis